MPAKIDPRDLYEVEKALDALEELHDYGISEGGGERVRDCLCREASAWRGARKVTVAWRKQLGLRVRLLDQV